MSVVFDLIARLAECETECETFSATSRVIVLNIKLGSQLQNRSDLNMSSRRGETLQPDLETSVLLFVLNPHGEQIENRVWLLTMHTVVFFFTSQQNQTFCLTSL